MYSMRNRCCRINEGPLYGSYFLFVFAQVNVQDLLAVVGTKQDLSPDASKTQRYDHIIGYV